MKSKKPKTRAQQIRAAEQRVLATAIEWSACTLEYRGALYGFEVRHKRAVDRLRRLKASGK